MEVTLIVQMDSISLPNQHLTQACSSGDSGCNRHMEILDRQNSSNPVKLILW